MGKVYAVKNGKVPGIYDSWEEAKHQVYGFPSAMFKSFISKDEAMAYMNTGQFLSDSDVDYTSLVNSGERVLFADGSGNYADGRGGYAAISIFGDSFISVNGGALDTTNNKMEIASCIAAIGLVPEWGKAYLFTDSMYCVSAILNMSEYKRMRWAKKGKPIVNAKELQSMDFAMRGKTIIPVWVRGHNGNPMNEECDRLAGIGAANVK